MSIHIGSNINIEWLGGNCPVQAEGTIDGFPFYFRARGSRWRLSIATGEDKDPVGAGYGAVEGWAYEEPYGTGPFDAGWMSEEEALEFISKAAKLFQETQS